MTQKTMYEKIESLQAELQKLQPLKREDDERLWKKFRLEWNYNSNHMEGNTLTYGHTELLLIFDKVGGDYSGREIEEMKAHDVAIKMVVELAKDNERDLTENFIRQLNEIILVRPYWKEAITNDGQQTRREITPGEYKKFPNSVRLENGEIFQYASPQETPAMMNDLMAFYKTTSDEGVAHPLWLAAMLHYKFVRIHPFDDGNGRVARLIMNYVLMKNNFPPVIIKDADKKKYITALNKADAGDLEAFVNYIGEQLVWSQEISIKAAKGEGIEEPDDVDKEVSLWKKQFKGNKANVMAKSDAQIHELYYHGIKQMYEIFIEKTKQFDELFVSKHIQGYVNNGSSGQSGFEYLENAIERWGQLDQNERTKTNEFNNLSLQIQFNGFNKDGINAFNIYISLTIEFLPYVYQIKFNSGVVKENLYSEFVDTETARSIVSHCVKNAFDNIKSQIKSNG